MKHLVIAEKPSVARDIARVLGCTKKSSSFMEGQEYIVTWALGHLVTLADPEEYDKKYQKWEMESLPIMPKQWKLVVIRQTSAQFRAVREQIYRRDVSDIIVATDAGREGELVARWILEKAECRKPLSRLWISSVTDKAIREGFSHIRSGKDYYPLYRAAVARAQADWLVGINATRALTCKYNAQLSCGRVQTPTLAIIQAREKEIREFKPQSYYGMKASAQGVSFVWTGEKGGSHRTFDKEKIERLREECAGEALQITEISRKAKKSFAPALYDLTALQREANAKYGFSAKETLNIMQRLYENHKVLTYPRTDSRYITSDMVGTLAERLAACAVGPYKKMALKLSRQSIRGNSSFVDNGKVSDHHAIIPTEQYVRLEDMSTEERKIYDMVVRRFLAVLSPACESEEISVKALLGKECFVTRGSVEKAPGWREAYESGYRDEQEEEEETDTFTGDLPVAEWGKGTRLKVERLIITTGKTAPPPYFTEGTLIAAMENPVKYMARQDSTRARTLGETGGLGTVATRADIIEKLFGSFLMEKKGKEIHLTSKGRQLLKLAPEDLKKPELTADWELRLKSIAAGQEKEDQFMTEIRDYTKQLIGEIRSAEGSFRHDNLTGKKCPDCGKFMLEVNGKHGKMLVCQDRECGHRETLARHTNARCPVCHKRMDLVGQGEGKRFVCVCGHREKMSSFEERRAKEGKGVSRQDVARYMRKQAKEAEEPVNSAFADALKNIKL